MIKFIRNAAKSRLGALGCRGRSQAGWRSDFNLFASLFGAFCFLGRPWDLKMLVWGRLRFDIGFRIKVEQELEAFGTREAPGIYKKIVPFSRADQKWTTMFRLRGCGRIEGRRLQKQKKTLDGPVFAYIDFGSCYVPVWMLLTTLECILDFKETHFRGRGCHLGLLWEGCENDPQKNAARSSGRCVSVILWSFQKYWKEDWHTYGKLETLHWCPKARRNSRPGFPGEHVIPIVDRQDHCRTQADIIAIGCQAAWRFMMITSRGREAKRGGGMGWGGRYNFGGVGWAAWIHLVELKNPRCPFQVFFHRYWFHIQDFQVLIRRASRISERRFQTAKKNSYVRRLESS